MKRMEAISTRSGRAGSGGRPSGRRQANRRRDGRGEAALAAVLSDESISPVERLRRYFAVQATALAEQNCERLVVADRGLHPKWAEGRGPQAGRMIHL
jgi:hypothetical protein